MIDLTIALAALSLVVIVGALVLLRVGCGREDRWATLRDGPPTKAAAAARRMTGLYVRMPQAPAGRETHISR
jgi:hypothetical protein